MYLDEKLTSRIDLGVAMFEPRDRSVKILFDSGFLIRQQYIMMKAPYAEELFNSWFENRSVFGGGDLIEVGGAPGLFAQLRKLGIPKGEHIYFKVAVGGNATLMVSLDSDFFDPSKKKLGEKEKRELLRSANGPVCKHMRKSYSITVCCPENFK